MILLVEAGRSNLLVPVERNQPSLSDRLIGSNTRLPKQRDSRLAPRVSGFKGNKTVAVVVRAGLFAKDPRPRSAAAGDATRCGDW